MMGHRFSSLPFTEFCGQAGTLGAQYGAGRPAAMGTAFHAICEGQEPRADGDGAHVGGVTLTADEYAEILQWKRPESVILGEDIRTLYYKFAEKEIAVALDLDGEACDPSDPRCMTKGTLDIGWVLEDEDGGKTAVVVDIKSSAYTVEKGAKSLQVEAYAYAYAKKHDCDKYVAGIFGAREGKWLMGEVQDTMFDGAALCRRIIHAATNKQTSTGSHCGGCYSRFHCPEHQLPGAVGRANPALAIVSEGHSGIVTQSQALHALLTVQAMKDVVKTAEEWLKTWARTHGGIEDGEGKVYREVETAGRSSFDKKALEKDHPGAVEKYTKRGKPGTSWRWCNK